MPEEDKIFRAFSECLPAPLEGVSTYEYMTNLNVYLNLCSSAVDWKLGCGTLGYLVLTAEPTVFNTHCGIAFITPRNPGIHLVMPDPDPTAAILSELIRTHKQQVRLFNEYHAVDRACKKFISKLILEKFYNSLSSRIIGFTKFTSLEILTHLITEYAELEEEDMQYIDSENERNHLRRNSVWRVHQTNWMESRSGSRAESVFSGSDCLYGLHKHWKMRVISRRLPRMFAQDTKWQDMGKLQGSLCSYR